MCLCVSVFVSVFTCMCVSVCAVNELETEQTFIAPPSEPQGYS